MAQRRLRSGERVTRIDTDFFNVLVDMVEERQVEESLSQQNINIGNDARVLVKNNAEDVLDWYNVVGLGGAIFIPNVNELEFKKRKGFDSIAPDPSKPFAILQDAGRPGDLLSATVSGLSQTVLNWSDTSHTFAVPVLGNYVKLDSTEETSSAEILYPRTPATTKLEGAIDDTVTTIHVDSIKGFCAASFVATIESEDVLVTALAGSGDRTWTVTRGYNSTTAAIHADDAVVTFKSGLIWAIVHLTGANASGDNLAEIMAAIACF